MKQKAKIKLVKKTPCPYCDRAMTLLNNKGYQVEIIDLTDNLAELQTWKANTGYQTVPMIFINEIFIGGYTDLKALDEEGKLDSMVME